MMIFQMRAPPKYSEPKWIEKEKGGKPHHMSLNGKIISLIKSECENEWRNKNAEMIIDIGNKNQ